MDRRYVCCMPKCLNVLGNEGISFFCIPRRNQVRKQWIQIIGTHVNHNSRVCSAHFVGDDLTEIGRLKKGAVPSVRVPLVPPTSSAIPSSCAAPETSGNAETNSGPYQLFGDLTDDRSTRKSYSDAYQLYEDLIDDPSKIDSDCEAAFEDEVKEPTALENGLLELCRICGKRANSLTSILEDSVMINIHGVPLVKMLEMHLPLQFRPGDMRPSNICSKCLNMLSDWHDLFVTCIAADKAFNKVHMQSSGVHSPKLQNLDFVSPEEKVILQDHDYMRSSFEVKEVPCSSSEGNDNVQLKQTCISSNPSLDKHDDFHVKENVCKNLALTECKKLSIPSDEREVKNYGEIVCSAESKGKSLSKDTQKTQHSFPKEFYIHSFTSFRCMYCHETFHDRSKQKLHHNVCRESPTVCEMCGKIVRRRSLSKHNYKKHSKHIVCEKCGQYVSKGKLYSHMKSAHSGSNYCDLCCSILRSRLSYNLHMKNHASGKFKSTFSFKPVSLEGKSVYICPVCGKSFDDKVSIIVHLNERLVIKCPKCNLKLCNEKRFFLHKCKQWNCQFCIEQFHNKLQWKEHERIHTGEKPYKCLVCDIRFRTMNQKTVHLRKHRMPSFECEYCSKKFIIASRLLDHKKRLHEGIRVTCEICEKKFSSETSLEKHLKRHNGNLVK